MTTPDRDVVEILTQKITELQTVSLGYESAPSREKLSIIKEKIAAIEEEVPNLPASQSAVQAIAIAQFKAMISIIKGVIGEYDKELTSSGE